MELRHLDTFLAVADTRHFGHAAARLGCAQSTVSAQLRRLETELGVRLVDRTSHTVALTAAGAAFRPEARRLVQQLARATAAARAAGAGTVTIGFNLAAGRLVLPAVLWRFTAEHPDVRTRLWERRSGPQAAALLAGDLDVGFGYGRASDPRLASRHLLTVPIVAVVGVQHPWAGRAAVPMRELATEGCLLFHRAQSPALHDAIVGAAARAGVDLDVRERVDDPIGTGVLVGTRPVVAFASAARALEPPPGLVAVPLTGPAPQVAVHVTWRATEQDPLVLSLVDAVVSAGPFAAGPPGQMA